MAREIERKFLLAGDGWRQAAERKSLFRQAYIATSATASVRIRTSGSEAWLNIKSVTVAASREEYEYSIPLADGEAMIATLTVGAAIEKTRYFVEHAGFCWEIDEFHGANRGLVVAEIELDSERQAFPRPDWLGAEVTHLERYYNVKLVDRPYRDWTAAERGA